MPFHPVNSGWDRTSFCPERVAAKLGLDPRGPRTPPDHAQRVGAGHALVGQLAGFAGKAPEQQLRSRFDNLYALRGLTGLNPSATLP